MLILYVIYWFKLSILFNKSLNELLNYWFLESYVSYNSVNWDSKFIFNSFKSSILTLGA